LKHVIYVDAGFSNGKGRLAWFNETTGNSDFRPSKCRDSFRCEYAAIVYTLGHCNDIKVRDEVEIRMDNEVVAKQLNHDSSINDDDIRTEAFRIWGWGRKKNNKVTFVRISRRENKAGKILGS
jgi:ribonuclease HI